MEREREREGEGEREMYASQNDVNSNKHPI
jgi:hypothetical protein